MKKVRILITGVAGLVGQNLVARMKGRNDLELLGIDKHPENCSIFRETHPEILLTEADLAVEGDWKSQFENIDIVIMNHAQIGALTEEPFIANNVTATKKVLDAAKAAEVPYIIHISSSVVWSQADDFYARSKAEQEKIVLECGIPTVVLRPTLMFGWFDRKHLGWLAQFMKRSPVFPIPNFGRYIRQPLYAGDFCSIIESCVDTPRPGEAFDISGQEKLFYVTIIKQLKKISRGRAYILPIPFYMFWALLKIYGLFSKNPPFTTTQLEALVIPEEFRVIDWPRIFGVKATSLENALEETYGHPEYSKIILEF